MEFTNVDLQDPKKHMTKQFLHSSPLLIRYITLLWFAINICNLASILQGLDYIKYGILNRRAGFPRILFGFFVNKKK